jgi:hypothetical protein
MAAKTVNNIAPESTAEEELGQDKNTIALNRLTTATH